MAADIELNDLTWPNPPPSDFRSTPVFAGDLLLSGEYLNIVYQQSAPPDSDPGTPFRLFNSALGDNNCNAGEDERPTSGVVWP